MSCGTNGRGCFYVGDSDGAVHVITRQLQAKTVAEAHLKGIIQISQCKQSAFLFSLGEDEIAAYSLKVWDTSLVEQDPMRSRLSLKSVIRLSRVKPPTYFAVHENLMLLAVGYEDGEIQLYRGELTRGRSIKPKILQREGEHGCVTGLAFKTMDRSIILFSVSKYAMTPFDVTTKDRDINVSISIRFFFFLFFLMLQNLSFFWQHCHCLMEHVCTFYHCSFKETGLVLTFTAAAMRTAIRRITSLLEGVM